VQRFLTITERIPVTVTTYHCLSTCLLSGVITMRNQTAPSAVAQRIIVEFLTNENVKPAQILTRLGAQFDDEALLRTQVSHLKKAEQMLKTCEDYTFYMESHGQSSLGFSSSEPEQAVNGLYLEGWRRRRKR
jgi:hypothetical protein